MALVEGIILRIFSNVIYVCIVKIFLFCYCKHLIACIFVKELTKVVEQLQGIPLTRIMACSNDYAAVGTAHGNSKLGCGRGCQSYVDNIVAHAKKRSTHNVADHLAADAGITSNDNLV